MLLTLKNRSPSLRARLSESFRLWGPCPETLYLDTTGMECWTHPRHARQGCHKAAKEEEV